MPDGTEEKLNPDTIVNDLVDAFNKLRFEGMSDHLGASQSYLISELEKLFGGKYFIGEERVQKSDIVFYDKTTIEPVIALEYEQSKRYIYTIQKMKKVADSLEGRTLKALVFSFWYEDAEGKRNLLQEIRKQLTECSVKNDKIWMMVGLLFPYQPSFQNDGDTMVVRKDACFAEVSIPDGKARIPRYSFAGCLIEVYNQGKIIYSDIGERLNNGERFIQIAFTKSSFIGPDL